MDIKVLSGGAANGLVSALEPAFTRATGMGISGDFGAVGGMRDRILAGEAVDLVILTKAIIGKLAESGHVEAASVRDVGPVATGVGVREGSALPDISTSDALREALLAADAIYAPDWDKATAGIHFAKVLAALGIWETLGPRLKRFPNGQTAMAAMAAGSDANPIGCTQITEILNTPGVAYAGDLPAEHALVTTYTAAVGAGSAHKDAGRAMIDMLTAAENAALRAQKGFGAA